MKTLSLADARKRALSHGAVLDIDGRVFNSGGGQVHVAQVRAERKATASPVQTAPQEPKPDIEAMVREQIAGLAQDMRAEFDRRIEGLQRQYAQALAAIVAAIPKQEKIEPRKPPTWKFHVEYDHRGALSDVIATPATPNVGR